LPDKSKKVSKFGNAVLKFGQAINQLGHPLLPERFRGKLMEGEGER